MHRDDIAAVPAEQAFPSAEYDARIARARVAMANAELDLLLVHHLPDICWLTGYQTPLSDWYSCLVLPLAGEPVLQVCDHELAVANTYVETFLPVQWQAMDCAPKDLVTFLRANHASRLRIGIQPRRPGLSAHVDAVLRAGKPDAQFDDASELVARLRAVKSDAEIACLREAARLSTLGMEAALRTVKAGTTENVVAAAAMQAIGASGGEYFSIGPFVRSGPRSGITHGTARRRTLVHGDNVLIEIGGVHARYCAPLLRTAVIGPPSDELSRLCDVSLAAMDLLFSNLRSGRTAGDVATATSPALARLDSRVATRGYFGYSVGISFPPSWVERSVEIAVGRTDVLVPGMVFHLHRALRIPGVVGVGFSETAVITANGCERLTQHPRELVVIA